MRHAHKSLQGLAALVLLALVASCDNGTIPDPIHGTDTVVTDTVDTDPSRDEGLILAVAELGARLQNITLTRDGVPVTDHQVLVNWVTIHHVGAGRYVDQLPSTVPAGSPIDLVLGGDGLIIYAAGGGTVPEAPVLTAPVTGATLGAGDSITVTWTSTTDPERFVVSGSFVVDGVTVDSTVPAAGDQRELRIAASELPRGTVITFKVVACNDGSLGGAVATDSRMSICAPSAPIAITTSTAASPLLISGGVGAQSQNIWIFQGGRDITDGVSDAVVTVNGVTIPNVGGRLYPGYYQGKLPAAVPPGSPLDLRVSARGIVVEATDNVPEAPVVTAPAAGAVFTPGGSITLRWTSLTDPDRFAVYVNTNHPVWHRELPGTARELEIAASELPAGSDLAIGVVAYNDGSFTGSAHPDSRMGIMSVRDRRVITINR